MFLADIHTGPCLLQYRLPVLANVPADDLADLSLRSDQFAILNEQPGRRGVPGGQSPRAMEGKGMTATPGTPGRPDPTTGPNQPKTEGREGMTDSPHTGPVHQPGRRHWSTHTRPRAPK